MYLFLFVVLLLGLLVAALFEKPAAVVFRMDTRSSDLYCISRWLYPLFMVRIDMQGLAPQLTLYFLKLRIWHKKFKTKPNKGVQRKQYLQAAATQESYAKVYYGFGGPAATAAATAALELLQMNFRESEISQFPDFLPDEDYVAVQAGLKLNLGKTGMKMFRMWRSDYRKKRSDRLGTVQYG